MQLKVVLVRSHANVEEDFAANESTLVCSRSLSVSLVDYFFTSTDAPLSQVIGFHDMYVIYKRIHSAMSSSINFSDFCAGKVKQSKRNSMLESYEKYLAQHRLVDIIDLFHYCHTKSTVKTIILSMKSISGQTDRLLAQYLLESPVLSWSVHDLTTESTTKENLLKLIHDASSSEELDDSKVNSLQSRFISEGKWFSSLAPAQAFALRVSPPPPGFSRWACASTLARYTARRTHHHRLGMRPAKVFDTTSLTVIPRRTIRTPSISNTHGRRGTLENRAWVNTQCPPSFSSVALFDLVVVYVSCWKPWPTICERLED